jgi:hypothetical protein
MAPVFLRLGPPLLLLLALLMAALLIRAPQK